MDRGRNNSSLNSNCNYMTDKQIEYLMDVLSGESKCCGAKLYGDICSDCKEHSNSIEE